MPTPVTNTRKQQLVENYEKSKANPTAVNPYIGTRFEQIYDQNPYKESLRDKTWIDELVSGLGFQSGYDIYEMQRKQAYNEYNAQIAQLASEEKYNEPIAQVDRMKAAGINPDIKGGVQANDASEFAQEQTSPDVSLAAHQNTDMIVGLAEEIIKTITGVLQISSEIPILRNTIDTNDAEVAQKIMGLSQDWLKNSWRGPIFHYNELSDDTEETQFPQYDPYFLAEIRSYADKNFRTRRSKKAFEENVLNLVRSMHGQKELYADMVDYQENKGKAARNSVNKYKGGGDFVALMRNFEPLVRLEETTFENEIKAKKEQSMNSLDYETAKSGTSQAAAENSDNEARQEANKVYKDMRNAFNGVMQNIENWNPETGFGRFLRTTFLILLPGMFLRYVDR